jgi:sulfide:quinone oxidoreductase
LYDCGLAETENGVRVDYDTLATKWDNVYAIGDCADMPASKAGGVAHQEADVLAHNLQVEITRDGEPIQLRLHTI